MRKEFRSFSKYIVLRESEMTCSKCGEPTSAAELTTYRGRCENCATPQSKTPWLDDFLHRYGSKPEKRRHIRMAKSKDNHEEVND